VIRRINHVQITIPKGVEAAARAFYCDVLGLREIAKPESLAGRGGFWVAIGDQQIHVGTEDGFDRLTTKAHIAYEVDDISGWRERVERGGAHIADSIPIPGFERFEARDPFGNRIEFIQPLTEGNSPMQNWTPFEDGETIGIRGTEGGTVIVDEQHSGGARITLERDCLRAPFAITCTIYDWAYHTRFLADEATAKQAYEDMKASLGDIVALLPQDDDDIAANADQIEQAVGDFAERFP
jgi:catechol 2,3-dioxygenase-like lactoylglutathione lyase family enzyme